MYRYQWDAVQDDGVVITRFAPDGAERAPDPWRTRQFHLYSLIDPSADPVSLFIPKGVYFHCFKRRVIEIRPGGDDDIAVIYVVGWDWPDAGCGTYLFLLPDGRYEMSSDRNHVTRFERNLEEYPLTKYERLR